jgi:hypothetical protein
MSSYAGKQSLALVTLSLCSILCLANLAFPTSQPAPAANHLQRFAGTWHAEFGGKTFLTLKLENGPNGLIGTISHCDFEIDKNGELTSAVQHDGSDSISNARLEKGVLRITAKDAESEDTFDFEMKLVGADVAQLRVITPSDVTAPKPWKLARSNAH